MHKYQPNAKPGDTLPVKGAPQGSSLSLFESQLLDSSQNPRDSIVGDNSRLSVTKPNLRTPSKGNPCATRNESTSPFAHYSAASQAQKIRPQKDAIQVISFPVDKMTENSSQGEPHSPAPKN